MSAPTPFPALLLLGALAWRSSGDCDDLQRLVRQTYDFRPSQLTREQQAAKSARMDAFWKEVESAPKRLAPCLRAALEAPDSDPWFRVDGSALLVEVDPTRSSKELQVRLWSAADLADLAPEVWMGTLAERGAEGFDLSVAAKRWLATPQSFVIAQHALTVNMRYGARFLIGSMDEALALPVLEPIAADAQNPAREVALDVLACLATPEALRTLARIGLEGCSDETRAALSPLLEQPTLLARRRPGARTSRTKLLAAMQDFVDGKPEKLDESQMLSEHEPNERWAEEVVGALREEDLPLLRAVRRKRMTYLSDEALEDYDLYSEILMTLVWKPELVK